MLAEATEPAVPDVDDDAMGGRVGRRSGEPVAPRPFAGHRRQRVQNRCVAPRCGDEQIDVPAGIGIPLRRLDHGVSDTASGACRAQLIHDLEHALGPAARLRRAFGEALGQTHIVARDRIRDPHDDAGMLGHGTDCRPIDLIEIEVRIVEEQAQCDEAVLLLIEGPDGLAGALLQHCGLGSVSGRPAPTDGCCARRVAASRRASRAPLRHRS